MVPIPRRLALRHLAAGSLCLMAATRLQAQAVNGVARIVIGSGPGSGIDTLARKVAEKLQPGYASAVVVENKTGASGQLAVGQVKTAAADGATLLLVPTPYMAIYPHTYRNLPYKPAVDFQPVSLGATFDLALAVGPLVPASVKTLAEFIAWCRQNPDKASFGSPAAGSTPHFTGAVLARAGGFKLEHVPYRGPTPAVQDLAGGQIAAACTAVGDLAGFAAAGRCRLLATTGAARNRFTPQVPTFAEQGHADLVIEDWFGFFVPAHTPDAAVNKAAEAIQAALASADVQQAMAQGSMVAQGSSPAALAARLRADTERWGPVVRAVGFTAES